MTTIELTIGWTRSDMANGYSSFDGYRPGAQQHTETVTVEHHWSFDTTAEAVVHALANAAFHATNHPEPEEFDPAQVQGQIYRQLRERGFDGSQSGHYSLSVGDTVTVGEVSLACASLGWERVVITPPMLCGHCDSTEHESRDCPAVARIQEAERAAEKEHS